MMVRRFLTLAVVTIAVSLVAAGCGGGSDKQSGRVTQSAGLQKLKVGWIGQLSDAGMIVADKQGYFRGQGLDPKFVQFDSGATMVAPLATGQLDFGGGAFSAGFANAVLQGRPMVMIADKNSYRNGHATDVIEVGMKVAGQIRSPADFRGRKVGIAAAPGTSAYVQFLQLLPKNGLKTSDVSLTSYSPSDLLLAVRQGAVDVGVMSEPTATEAEIKGYAKPMMTGAQFAPGAQVAVLFTSKKLTTSQPALVQRFVNAYACGVRDYRAAMDKGTARAKIIGEISAATSVAPDIVAKARPVGLADDLNVNAASVAQTIKALQDNGALKQSLDAGSLIDNSFATKATNTLSCPTG